MEEFERYTFHAKQDGSGEAFLVAIPSGDGLTVLRGGMLTLSLPKGTSGEEATRLADYLDEQIATINYLSNDEELG